MSDSVLDVEKSLNEARWAFLPVEAEAVARISQNYGLPEFVARMLVLRGVKPDKVEAFLYPTLQKNFPDPFDMVGMRAFAEDLAGAVIKGRKIGVFADFDVDGATSAAVLTRFFRAIQKEEGGQDVPVYIPDRLREGYGPNAKALESLKEQGAEIVLIADCGITSFEPIKAGREMGLEITVFDHHEAEDTLPDANHIINPKRKDDISGLDMLAACGVSFLACVAINNVLRAKGYYKDNNLPEPQMKKWLDIVALGTVCDMVPLTGASRLFVRAGFEQMAKSDNPGIKALCEVSKIEGTPTVQHAGWSLGPRINAGSRVHKSDLGARLLSCDDLEEARSIAWTLEKCNEERKEIQSVMMADAIASVEAGGLDQNPVIVVDAPEGHPGLSGLVAGRIKERFGKPAIVVTYTKNTEGVLEGRGSGRSVAGANMAEAFIAARNEGLLMNGGGHAMAGGFSLEPDKLSAFTEFLYQNFKKQSEGFDLTKETIVDGVASVRGAQLEFIKILEQNVGPFGMGNAEPVFALANVRVHSVDILKEKHIRALVSDWEGGTRMKTMLFGGVGTPLGDALLKNARQPFHLLGKFQINRWQGRESVEFHISDGVLTMVEEPQQRESA